MDPIVQHLQIELDPARKNLLYHYSVRGAEDVPRHIPAQSWNEAEIQELAADVFSLLSVEAGAPGGVDLTHERLKKTAGKLYDKLIPCELSSLLNQPDDPALSDSYLLLGVDPDLLWIPWELLFDGEQFLCQRFRVSREILRRGEEVIALKVRVRRKRSANALVASGDTRNLKVSEEMSAVKTELQKIYCNARSLGKLSAGELLEELKRDHEVVHFVGHGAFSQDNSEKTGWQCAKSTLLSCKEIAHLPTAAPFPFLIFANACDSARPSLAPSRSAESYISDLYLAFLRRGVPHYIGTLAPIPDELSGEFAGNFYRLLSEGATIGDALTETRRAFMGRDGPPIWAYYVHYGNPTYRSLPKEQAIDALPKQDWRTRNWLTRHKLLLCLFLVLAVSSLALRAILALYRHGYFYSFPRTMFGVAVVSLLARDVAATGKEHSIDLFSRQDLDTALSQTLPETDFNLRVFNVSFHNDEEARRWGLEKHATVVIWGSAEQGTNALIVHLKATRVSRPEIGRQNGALDRSFLYILFKGLFRDAQSYAGNFHLPELSLDLSKPEQIQALNYQAALLTAHVRGVDLFAQGDFRSAAMVFQKVANSQKVPDLSDLAKRWLVLAYLQGRHYIEAVRLFSSLVDIQNISDADRVRLAFLEVCYERFGAGVLGGPGPAWTKFLQPAATSEEIDPALRGVAIALLGEAKGVAPPWYFPETGHELEPLIQSAVAEDPRSYFLRYLLAMLTTKEGVREGALDTVQKLNPSRGVAHFGRALWDGATGHYANALKNIDAAIAAEPTNTSYWIQKAEILQNLFRLSPGHAKALARRRIISICEAFLRTPYGTRWQRRDFLWNLVRDYYREGEPKRAVVVLKKGLQEFPEDAQFCTDATLVSMRQLQAYGDAGVFLRCAEKFSSSHDAKIEELRSELNWRAGDFGNVLFGYWFNSPLWKRGDQDLSHSVALSDIEGNLLNSAGKYADAENALRHAQKRAFQTPLSKGDHGILGQEFYPDIPENDWKWRWAPTYDLGLLFLSEGNFPAATATFAKALKTVETSPFYLVWEGDKFLPAPGSGLPPTKDVHYSLVTPPHIQQFADLTRMCQGYAYLKTGDYTAAANSWWAAAHHIKFYGYSGEQLKELLAQLTRNLQAEPNAINRHVQSDELEVYELLVHFRKYQEAVEFIRTNSLIGEEGQGNDWKAKLLYAYVKEGNYLGAESAFLDFARTHGWSPSFKNVFSGLSSSLYTGWFEMPGNYNFQLSDYFFGVISINP